MLRHFPYLLAIGTLLLLCWAALLIVQRPYSGLSWSYRSGIVTQVDPLGPAAGLFHPGDRIVAIDGLPPYEARYLPERQAGDLVAFTLNRNEEAISLHLKLARPAAPILLTGLTTILVALSFWLIGLLVTVFGPSAPVIRYFFLFSLVLTLILGMGSVSSYGPLWSGWIFNLLQWWIGPLTLHTHFLIANARYSANQSRLLRFLYVLAFIFSLLDMQRLYWASAGPLLTVKYLTARTYGKSATLIWPVYLWENQAVAAVVNGEDYRSLLPGLQVKAENYLDCILQTWDEHLNEGQLAKEVKQCMTLANSEGN